MNHVAAFTRDTELDQLGRALRLRLSVIADHGLRDHDPEAHLKKLQEASLLIEKAACPLVESRMHPELRHFLERRSYDKALAWIEEERKKNS